MTVPADSAKDQVQTATTGLVNLRENSRWAGGSLFYDGCEQLVTGWHFHNDEEFHCERQRCAYDHEFHPDDGSRWHVDIDHRQKL